MNSKKKRTTCLSQGSLPLIPLLEASDCVILFNVLHKSHDEERKQRPAGSNQKTTRPSILGPTWVKLWGDHKLQGNKLSFAAPLLRTVVQRSRSVHAPWRLCAQGEEPVALFWQSCDHQQEKTGRMCSGAGLNSRWPKEALICRTWESSLGRRVWSNKCPVEPIRDLQARAADYQELLMLSVV